MGGSVVFERTLHFLKNSEALCQACFTQVLLHIADHLHEVHLPNTRIRTVGPRTFCLANQTLVHTQECLREEG